MALFVATGHGGCSGGRIICSNPTKHHPYTYHRNPSQIFLSRRARQVAVSAKKLSSSSRPGRFDRKNKKSTITIRDQEDDTDNNEQMGGEMISDGTSSSVDVVDDDYYEILSKLPKDEPDFWEGPQWDALGFFLQYLWAFGIVFAVIACGIAVATYNEGSTDFKKTPAYKESVQSKELLEEPDASNSDVFESNPTEVAPSLD